MKVLKEKVKSCGKGGCGKGGPGLSPLQQGVKGSVLGAAPKTPYNGSIVNTPGGYNALQTAAGQPSTDIASLMRQKLSGAYTTPGQTGGPMTGTMKPVPNAKGKPTKNQNSLDSQSK